MPATVMQGLDRRQPPKSEEITQIRIPEVSHHKLANGIDVYCIQNSTQEILRFDAVFRVGSWHSQKPLVASMTNQMLDEGSLRFNSAQIAEKLDVKLSTLFND